MKGTGLGLFVAQRMAEAMGGNISAYSEGEGKGSRFSLTLPLAM
ncbi:MAG: ATP-binding protein [Candidatus Paceibacterota bacterium]